MQRLEAAPATKVVGLLAEENAVTTAANGHTLVVWHPPSDFEHVFYRIYDRTWTPLSNVLEVGVGLEVVRGLHSSFLARATVSSRSGMRYVLEEWVVISAHGRMRRIAQRPGEHHLAPGDLRARTPFAHGSALRGRTGPVVRLTRRPWESAARPPYVDDRGAVCVVPPGTRSGHPVFTSLDDGLTWRKTTTTPSSTLRVQSCAAAGDRVVVMTGGEYPLHMSTFDRTSNSLLSRIRLGDRRGDSPYSGYGWQLLPDGRLVFDARRPGLLVATDSSNQQFVLRPGPPGLSPDVVGGRLVDSVGARRFLLVSNDAGRTWSQVDLRLPGEG